MIDKAYGTILFILSHPPDPRIIKRTNSIRSSGFATTILFWNRLPWQGTGYDCQHIPTMAIGRPIAPGWGIRRFACYLSFCLKCWPYIQKVMPKVLYCSGPDSLLLAVLYKMFHPRVRLIYEVADIQWLNQRGLARRLIGKAIVLFERLTLPRAVSLLVLTSPFYWDMYYHKFVRKEHSIVLQNCPPSELFSSYRRRPWDGRLVVGWVGFVRYRRQIELLLKAVHSVPGTVALIAGDGPDLQYVRELTKGRKDVILLGRYDYTDVANIYSRVDCVFAVYDADIPNVRMSLPNRLYEAIQCELPIIVAKGTKLAKLVEGLGIGFAVDHTSVEELREILNRLKNRAIQETVARNCAAIKREYTWERMEKEFIARIRGVINT